MNITAYDVAERFVGIKEEKGPEFNPQIMAMLQLDASWPEGDEVPWCSGFINYCAWLLRLPRSKSLRARSWLEVGRVVERENLTVGYDVVILSRGLNAPGPDVINAPGHVGFFGGFDGSYVMVLGGNQGDTVSLKPYPSERVLGYRRLWQEYNQLVQIG